MRERERNPGFSQTISIENRILRSGFLIDLGPLICPLLCHLPHSLSPTWVFCYCLMSLYIPRLFPFFQTGDPLWLRDSNTCFILKSNCCCDFPIINLVLSLVGKRRHNRSLENPQILFHDRTSRIFRTYFKFLGLYLHYPELLNQKLVGAIGFLGVGNNILSHQTSGITTYL